MTAGVGTVAGTVLGICGTFHITLGPANSVKVTISLPGPQSLQGEEGGLASWLTWKWQSQAGRGRPCSLSQRELGKRPSTVLFCLNAVLMHSNKRNLHIALGIFPLITSVTEGRDHCGPLRKRRDFSWE